MVIEVLSRTKFLSTQGWLRNHLFRDLLLGLPLPRHIHQLALLPSTATPALSEIELRLIMKLFQRPYVLHRGRKANIDGACLSSWLSPDRRVLHHMFLLLLQ
jgi:hypothetical protein